MLLTHWNTHGRRKGKVPESFGFGMSCFESRISLVEFWMKMNRKKGHRCFVHQREGERGQQISIQPCPARWQQIHSMSGSHPILTWFFRYSIGRLDTRGWTEFLFHNWSFTTTLVSISFYFFFFETMDSPHRQTNIVKSSTLEEGNGLSIQNVIS